MATTSKKKKQSTPEVDSVLSKVLKMERDSTKYAKRYYKNWETNDKLYNNTRVKRLYKGISQSFDPMTFSTIETMKAALSGGGSPRIAYSSDAPAFEEIDEIDEQTAEALIDFTDQDTETLNSLVMEWWSRGKYDVEVDKAIDDLLRKGNFILMTGWDGKNSRMTIEYIPIKDAINDPLAKNPDERRYAGRRFRRTIEQLKEETVVNPDFDSSKPEGKKNKEFIPKYKNLDGIMVGNTSEDPDKQTDKERKDGLMGSTLGVDNKEQLNLVEIVTPERHYIMAERKVMIYDEENPIKAQAKFVNEVARKDYETAKSEFTQQMALYEASLAQGVAVEQPVEPSEPEDLDETGMINFIMERNYIDGSLLYGKSEIDFIADLQERLNDKQDQLDDALLYAQNQMYTLDPEYSEWIEHVENLPGAVYPFRPGALQPIDKGTIPNEAFAQIAAIKDQIRETTSASEIVKGASGDKRATLGEKELEIEQSGARFAKKVRQIEDNSFYDLAKQALRYIQLFIEEPLVVRVTSETGTKFEIFDPTKFTGDFEPKVQLESTALNKESNERANDIETFKLFMEVMPNPAAVVKHFGSKITDFPPEIIEEMITPPEPAPEQLPPEAAVDPAAQGALI